MPRLCEFYPGISLTTEEKARKTLSQVKKNLSQVNKNLSQNTVYITGVQLKSGPYFNTSNLFTKIYNMLYYATNLYLQQVLEMK